MVAEHSNSPVGPVVRQKFRWNWVVSYVKGENHKIFTIFKGIFHKNNP